MKKTLALFFALLLAACLTACAEQQAPPTPKNDITGISFLSDTFIYDGTEKSIHIQGELPSGVTVEYTNSSAVNAGTYNAIATLSGEGYNTLVLNATLTINKADIVGISAESVQEIDDDGETHAPVYTGNVPGGVSVKYLFDGIEGEGVDEVGEYAVKIVFEGANYNTLSLDVAFKIKFKLGAFADRVIDAFGHVPDVWQFLPDSFAPENKALETSLTYSDFVNVSDIPVNGMGKQLNMVYGLLNKTELALSYVNRVYGAMNVIKTLYSNYLDGSPEDYKNFRGSAGSFDFSINVTDADYSLSASIGPIEVIITSNLLEESYGAYIKLNSTTSVRYTVSADAFVFAMDILDSAAILVEFITNEDGKTIGTVYEYLTVNGIDVVATSALIEVGEDYTVVIGTKGDFIPMSVSRNCEVYDNESGKLVGTKVREDVDGIVYNTYWFPLISLNGVNSIKKIDEMNGTNADTIYINGCSDTLHTTLIGLSGGSKMFSRRYDIEFKTMYFYALNVEGEYESVAMEVPMLFIQEENVDTFETDFTKSNKTALASSAVDLVVAQAQVENIDYGYTTLLTVYDALKELVTREEIISYCKAPADN